MPDKPSSRPLVKGRRLPDGSLVCRSLKYAKDEEIVSRPDAPVVIGALLYCQIEPARAEYSEKLFNATGRYEGTRTMACLNQAGHHIELWVSRILEGGAGHNRKVFRYAGDFNFETREFKLYFPPSPDTLVGRLRVTGNARSPRLEFEWVEGQPLPNDTLHRFSDRATLSDHAMARLRAEKLDEKNPFAQGTLDSEHAPLSPSRLATVEAHLRSREFHTQLQTLFSVEPKHSNKNRDLVRTQIERIEARLDFIRHSFADADRSRFRAWVRPILESERLKLRTPDDEFENRTLYDWLKRVLLYNEEFTAAPAKVPSIKRWLGVERSDAFTYQLEFEGAVFGLDVAVPFGKALSKRARKSLDEVSGRLPKRFQKGFKKYIRDKVEGIVGIRAGGKYVVGNLTVRSEPPQPEFEALYALDFWLAGVGSGGKKVGESSITAKGYMEAPEAWLPQNFPGRVYVHPGRMATDPHGRRAKDQFILMAEGSGTDASRLMVFNEVKSQWSKDFLGHGRGSIELLEDLPTPKEPKFRTVEYEKRVEGEDDVHFVLGSATVRDEGRHALRVFAANELASLRDPDSRLVIRGFADRLGRRWYNDALSTSRAANVEQALRACLGDDLGAQVEIDSAGERFLEMLDTLLDFPDESPAPEWRRTFVILDSHASVALRVRDLKDIK